ncbi:MAG: hypothetical protein EOP48_22885 [Sphingobacteriales bacterium]|nr:MAG: hypothetical protein EOP48_22885 [Sphingobacteriales bacterium]
MSSSFTQTFTATNAKYLASKVSADLKRIQRFYGFPTDANIALYEQELAEYLKRGFLEKVTYGFRKNGKFIEPSLVYTAQDIAGYSATDDDPGKIRPGADVSGASFGSYLIHNSEYDKMTVTETQAFVNGLPISRTGSPEPGIDGYLNSDNSYSSGGKSLNRSSVKKI